VDWDGYLTQQLRWARSVIDIKCRLHRLLGRDLPPSGRALSALHGFCYLQNSATTFAGLLLLAYMLATGDVPRVVGYEALPGLALLCAALQACAFYRQKFYLKPGEEWGLHWRAALLRYAKWPVFLWALWDVAVGRRVAYAITPKVKSEPRSYKLLVPHALVIALVCAAWGGGLILGSKVPSPLYWVAAAVAAASLSLILTDRARFPAPYDKRLLSSRRYGGANAS
jgi:cellulose synthase (UDP-forming)